MKTVRSTDQKTSISDRVSLKLALLFIGSFLAVLILIVGWTVLTAIGDSRDSAAESEAQTPPIIIDPKIGSDLTKALSFDAIPAATDVQNPFLDRANIGSNLTVTNPSNPSQDWSYVTLFDGVYRPVQGQPGAETAVEIINPKSIRIYNKRDGVLQQVVINTLSDDNNTINNEYIRMDKDGKITGVSHVTYNRRKSK